MAPNRDSGCDSVQFQAAKDIERQLVNLLSPLVYFEPQERFFPVDLVSAIRASSLWLANPQAQPPAAQCEKLAGAIDPVIDLPTKTVNHYTTVAGNGSILKVIPPQPPFNMPIPLLDEVHRKYTDGTIGPELTLYATVCNAHDVPNAHLFKGATVADQDVAHALPEGLIVSYYMYFPACESPELQSEGDWSGISLLLPARPTQPQDLTDPQRLPAFLPVVAAYYRKTIDGAPPSPYLVAADGGFRRWKNIQKGSEPSVGLDTHPIVYISRGRHNCYYEPATKPIPLSPPWQGKFTPDKIETGAYTPGPANNTLIGGGAEDTPWWVCVAFPWMLFFTMCATGCEYPVHFDTSGLPAGHVDGQDATKSGGYNGLPGATSSPYPPTTASDNPAAPRDLALKLQYVDLSSAATAGLWRYPGAWGAATQVAYTFPSDPQHPSAWGYYRGARRPALAAWFLWNLFLDTAYGCGGSASVTPVP